MLKIIVFVIAFGGLSAWGQVAPILLQACGQMEPASKRSECLRAANQVPPAGETAGPSRRVGASSALAGPAAQHHAPKKSKSLVAGTGQTCYTGPRGGTYTITKSGRKNYSGC